MSELLPSGRQTGDAAIMARPGHLGGFIVEADGTNGATLILYDNASAASGTVLAKVLLLASQKSGAVIYPPPGVRCANGIYADITGTNAAYEVYYRPGAESKTTLGPPGL